jgi:hypothetical protein
VSFVITHLVIKKRSIVLLFALQQYLEETVESNVKLFLIHRQTVAIIRAEQPLPQIH